MAYSLKSYAIINIINDNVNITEEDLIVDLYDFIKNFIKMFKSNKIDYFNMQILEYAAKNNYFDIIYYLINTHQNINKCEILEYASLIGRVDIVKHLVETCNVVPNNNSLLFAIRNYHIDVIKYLIDHGVYISQYSQLESIISTNNLELIKYFVEYEINLQNLQSPQSIFRNGINLQGIRMPQSILVNGNLEIIKYLRAHGVSIEWIRKYPPLNDKTFEVIKYISENKHDLFIQFNQHLLSSALKQNNLKMVEYFINNGANPNHEIVLQSIKYVNDNELKEYLKNLNNEKITETLLFIENQKEPVCHIM